MNVAMIMNKKLGIRKQSLTALPKRRLSTTKEFSKRDLKWKIKKTLIRMSKIMKGRRASMMIKKLENK